MSMYMFKGVSVCVEGLWGCVHVEGVYVYLCFCLGGCAHVHVYYVYRYSGVCVRCFCRGYWSVGLSRGAWTYVAIDLCGVCMYVCRV